MKHKLGKKLNVYKETLEAYTCYCTCSCYCSGCSCYCGSNYWSYNDTAMNSFASSFASGNKGTTSVS